MAVPVRPAGIVSVTVTAPLVGPVPMFDTVSVYVPVCPRVKLPACDFVILRSGSCVIAVTSLAALLAALTSPPPETLAVFVTLAGAVAATWTVMGIGGKLAPAPRVSLRVQVRVPREHVQPVPAIAAPVILLGSVSATVTVPLVGPEPMLVTVRI